MIVGNLGHETIAGPGAIPGPPWSVVFLQNTVLYTLIDFSHFVLSEGSEEGDVDEGGGEREEVDIEEAVIQATQQPQETEDNVILKQQRELVNYLKVNCLYPKGNRENCCLNLSTPRPFVVRRGH